MIVYFNPIVMLWFAPEDRPVINGLNAVAFNVGTAIILWGMTGINAITGSWQSSLVLFSAASLVLAILWLLVKFDTPAPTVHAAGAEPAIYGYLEGLKDQFNWAYAFTYSGLLSFYICLFTFYPQAGISQSKWVIGFGIVGTIAGMLYSRKNPLRLPIIRWSGLIIVITVLGLSFSTQPWLQVLCAIVLGFFIFFPVTALVSIPHELPMMTGQKITVVFSLFWSISYLVSTIVLWVFGKLVDLSDGSYFGSFVMITILSGTVFVGSYFLPETGKSKELI